MIVLDTNVLSAVLLRIPDRHIANWLDRLASGSVWTTAVTLYEIRFGLEVMPGGSNRERLEGAVRKLIDNVIPDRILHLDKAAAESAAGLAARQRRIGRPSDIRDILIAGIVSVHDDATLATRNTKHFEGIGIRLINPWIA